MKEIKRTVLKEEVDIIVTNKISDIERDWDAHCRDSIYFKSDYHKILETDGPIGYKYYYVLVLRNAEIIGVYYFQKKTIQLSNDFRVHTHSKNIFKKFGVAVQKFFFKYVKHDILVSGNVLLTGEYSHFFSKEQDDRFLDLLSDTVFSEVKAYIKDKENIKIQSILSKDFYLDNKYKNGEFRGSGFYGFEVQPDMIFKVREDWNEYQDFLNSVKSKYRVKFKKVAKKGSALIFKELNLDELRFYNDKMYELYSATSDKALFTLFKLDKEYFIRLKEVYPEDFKVHAVLIENELVAFYTLIYNGKNADAHFLGYDISKNSNHQIYFNILLKLVEQAITSKSEYLNLSRTALEIKSSVGAEPFGMKIFLRHENSFINGILPSILKRVVPKNEWIQRVPYK